MLNLPITRAKLYAILRQVTLCYTVLGYLTYTTSYAAPHCTALCMHVNIRMRAPAETRLGRTSFAVVAPTGLDSLRKGGIREGVSKAVAPQDRQMAAHASNIDDSTSGTPARRQQQQQHQQQQQESP